MSRLLAPVATAKTTAPLLDRFSRTLQAAGHLVEAFDLPGMGNDRHVSERG